MPHLKHWSTDPALLPAYWETLREDRGPQLKEARTWTSMWINRPDLLGQDRAGTAVYTMHAVRELGFNTLAECFGGALSQVARPLRARVEPSGDDWKIARACRGLAPVLDGIFQLANFRKKSATAFEQALACPDVVILWEDDALTGHRVAVNLDPFGTFVVSQRDEMVTRRPRSRRWLKAVYASGEDEKSVKLREAIDDLPDFEHDRIAKATRPELFASEDLVAVYEGYLSPIGDGKKAPGRHVIVLSEAITLTNEEWNKRAPWTSVQWAEGLMGPSDGAPLGRRLGPLQALETRMRLQRNDIIEGQVPSVENAQEGQKPSNVAWHALKRNKDGTYPKIVVPPGTPPDLAAEITESREASHRLSGISEETAEGTVPSSITSGIGISNYVAVINQRLSQQHQAYQFLWLDSARINIALGEPKTKADDGLSAQIDWKLLALPASAFVLKYEVVNELTDHLPYRLDLLEKLFEKQAIELDVFLAHIEDGNVGAVIARLNAERNYIEFQIDQALDHQKLEPPVPFQDPKKLAKAAAEAWMIAKVAKVPPPPLAMDALWLLQAQAAAAAGSDAEAVANDNAAAPLEAAAAPATTDVAAASAPIPAAAPPPQAPPDLNGQLSPVA